MRYARAVLGKTRPAVLGAALAACAFPTQAVAYYDTEIGGSPADYQQGSTAALEDFFNQRYVLETKSPRHPTKVPKFVIDPAAPTSDRKVMVVHLESSDPSYTPGLPAQRSEISVKKEYTPPGQERWYALSFYLDQYWPIYDKKTKFVLAQLHTSQKTVVLQPNVEISTVGDQLSLTSRNNTRPVPPYAGAIPPSDDYYASKANTSQSFVKLGKLQRSQWYCFVINTKWSHTAHKGHTKIWMNGQMVHEQYNHPNTYENLDPTLGNYPKIGVYAPGGFSSEVWAGRVAWVKSYVDFISLADPGGVGPNEMFSRTPCKGVVPDPTFPKS